MSRKIKLALFLIVMLGALVFSAMAVSAAALGEIDVTVKSDAATPAVVSGLSTKLYDPSGYDTGITPVASAGVYKFQNLATAGAYTVLFYTGDATTGASVNAAVTLSAASATSAKIKAANLTWVDPTTVNPNKSGVIVGFVNDGNTALQGVEVRAYNDKGTYISESAANGAYKIYVPADTYTLVIVGKEASQTDDQYKNFAYSIAVAKGRMTGLMNDIDAQTQWYAGENTNGLTFSGIDGNDNTIKGYALANATVSAYVYTGSDTTGRYTFIASAKVGTNTAAVRTALGSTSTTQGAFTISLPTYYPNQKIALRVKDAALNVYEEDSYINTPVAANSMTLTADSTNATISQPIDITFADATAPKTMTSYLKSKIATVTATYGSTTITLTPTTQYTVGTSKVTIAAGVLSTPQDYLITVSAPGYTDGSVTQTIGTSTTDAPTTIGGTFTVKSDGGTVPGSAQFTVIGAAGTGDSLVYVVSSYSAAQVKLGNPLTGYSYTTLAANTNITGVGYYTTNPVKYIHVYEINHNAAVVKAKVFTLSAAQIKSPSFTSATASAATIVLTADAALDGSSVPAASAFAVKKGTATKSIAGVAVSGSQVILSLTDTNTNQIVNGDTITVNYTKPTSGYLKDAYGNAIATKTGVCTITNQTPTAVTVSSAATTSATEIVITMSGALTGSAGDTAAFVVKKGTTAFTTTAVAVSGTTVTITIDGPISSGDAITVSYTATGTNDLTDGIVKVANFTGHTVTTQ